VFFLGLGSTSGKINKPQLTKECSFLKMPTFTSLENGILSKHLKYQYVTTSLFDETMNQ